MNVVHTIGNVGYTMNMQQIKLSEHVDEYGNVGENSHKHGHLVIKVKKKQLITTSEY